MRGNLLNVSMDLLAVRYLACDTEDAPEDAEDLASWPWSEGWESAPGTCADMQPDEIAEWLVEDTALADTLADTDPREWPTYLWVYVRGELTRHEISPDYTVRAKTRGCTYYGGAS